VQRLWPRLGAWHTGHTGGYFLEGVGFEFKEFGEVERLGELGVEDRIVEG
jgi:hypothetical protein